MAASAGNGGNLAVNAATTIALNNTTITATTGIIDPTADAAAFGGTGGDVSLNAAGTINVTASTIQVSSNDLMGTPNRRSSSAGGNINISSAANTGTAIMVDNTSQLLSLLENATPGPGGLIRIEATSVTGNQQINIDNGGMTRIVANKGGIDVRNFSDTGAINLTNAGMIADVIKIAALGDNSTLNVSGGIISASTLLRLYAGNMNSANSTINFLSSVQLNGNQIDIVAHTVNIAGGAVVTTNSLANVYTTIANYQGSGGTGGGSTGMFGGVGATTNPQNAAPLLGPPGGP